MFTKDETEALKEFAYSYPQYELEDFLYDKQIDVIKEGGTRANNLLNRIFVPQHNKPSKTIRVQQLVNELVLEDWLLGIADCLRYGKLLTVNLGFSYLVWKLTSKDIRYVYAAKALSYDRVKLHSKSEFYDFAGKFRKLTNEDFLMNTFLSQLRGNVFESSGFIPQKLVCAYCWLTK